MSGHEKHYCFREDSWWSIHAGHRNNCKGDSVAHHVVMMYLLLDALLLLVIAVAFELLFVVAVVDDDDNDVVDDDDVVVDTASISVALANVLAPYIVSSAVGFVVAAVVVGTTRNDESGYAE